MEENQDEEKKAAERMKKIEKQSITLLIILSLVLISFIVTYFIFKPKPYFMYEDMKVYPLRYGQSNFIIYSFPLVFNVDGTNFEEEVLIRYNPFIVENISYSVNESLFRMAKIGITMNPDYNSAAFLSAKEISGLAEKIRIPVVFGVNNYTENPDILIFDCQNSTELLRIVRMELSNETKVFNEGNCIIVQGENYDSMMMAADKLVIEWIKSILKK